MTNYKSGNERPANAVLMAIPFHGFYDTIYSDLPDINMVAYNEAEDQETGERGKKRANYLHLTEGEIECVLYDNMQWHNAYMEIASDYVSAMNIYFKQEHNANLQLVFAELDSPREYNFTTDRIFAWIPMQKVRGMFALSKKDSHNRLAHHIQERFTSRSGFISHYENELTEWLNKPLEIWDHNELETLFLSYIDIVGDNVSNIMGERLYYMLAENNEYADSHIDWAAYEAERANVISDKLAAHTAKLRANGYRVAKTMNARKKRR